MVQRLYQSLAHEPGGSNGTVQPRMVHHLNNRAHTAPFFTHDMRPGRFKLHLAGSVGPVAHLIFQALDEEFVLLSGWGPARKKKAGKTLLRLGQNKKGVAHGRGTEPLVPRDQVFSRTSDCYSASRVGSNVCTALLLRHPHSQQHAWFFRCRYETRI